ncbi:Putative Flp pilus-assembly TadE/G-like [Streptomyces sp. 1222.5]|nr:putative Flp pilus-assembly TadE/G-like protein [Streptomyces sp. 5112.2]SEC25259.1 Putative Flp pilus-assembly TadE/G-like [Streptomyces sp. 1222.5]
MVAGLLFLAFAYLAVGQAAVNRGGAQTAADAAALAAAQKTRDQLADMWLDALSDPDQWQAILNGEVGDDFCSRAGELADQNDASVLACTRATLAYAVEVRTNKTVGDSVVPGTENRRSTAHARAVIESLCTFPPPGDDTEDDTLPELTCGDQVWDPKPDDPPSRLPKPDDLFDVHLAD